MKTAEKFLRGAGLVLASVGFSATLVGAADSGKRILPKCSTQIDPNDDKLILMVCDFSDISVAEKIVSAKAEVDITDGSGKPLRSQTLQFADGKHPLRGGKKYARRFEYAGLTEQTSGLKVKISTAEAVIEPDISAIEK